MGLRFISNCHSLEVIYLKAKWLITFIFIFGILGFFITLSIRELIIPNTLTTTEITTQVERVYNASVQSLIKKSDYYVASFNKDGNIYEVHLNPITGQFSNLQVIYQNEANKTANTSNHEAIESEKLDEDTHNIETNVLLTEQQAIELALKEIPGEIDSVDFKETTDGGNYLIEIEQEKYEITIQIHAITGKILSIQYDD